MFDTAIHFLYLLSEEFRLTQKKVFDFSMALKISIEDHKA
jgi:hypothetical protein